MGQLTLQRPEYLLLLALVPLLGIGMSMWRKKRRMAAVAFAGREVYRKITERQKDNYGIRLSLMLTAFTLSIIALANPSVPGPPEKTVKRSSDIFLAIDVSRSMQAQDIAPNRLTKAKLWATELVNSLKGQQIGLVVFAGAAYMYMPLTDDYNAAIDFINGITTEMASYQGTAIGAAIETAQKAFGDDSERRRGLVIITDGEDHDSNAIQTAEKAAGKGIVITTIGAGTEKGALIPDQDDLGFKYKLDEEGQPIRSKLNVEELKKIAAAAQGRYYNLDNPRAALEGIEKMVEGLDKGTYDVHDTSNNISLFPWLLWPAFFLFLLETVMSMNIAIPRKRKDLAGVTPVLAMMILLLHGSAFGQNTHGLMKEGNKAYRSKEYQKAAEQYDAAAKKKPDFNSLYNEANALFQQGKYPEASEKNMEAFQYAKTSEQKNMVTYNLGNSFFKTKEYEKAIDAYKQALRNNPGDLDAKANLTRALMEKHKQDEQKKNNQQNKDQQKDQNQDQDKKDNQNQQKQQNQNQQNKDQQRDDKGNQAQNKNQSDQQNKQNNQGKPQNLSPQEAESLLRIMKEEEKNTRGKVMKRQQPEYNRSGKDW